MTGEQNYENGSHINARNARSLTDRAGLKITVDGDYPLALVSTSGYKEVFDVWNYDANDTEPDGRGKTVRIWADGRIKSVNNITAGGKFISTILDSGQNSNLQLQHNGNTKVYVGGSMLSINTQGKLGVEGTEDDHLITKKYVDDKIAENAIGSCVEINGGQLCADEPHPGYYDTFKNYNSRITVKT